MSKELVRKLEGLHVGRWAARLIGAAGIAATLVMQAEIQSSPDSEVTVFNPGITLLPVSEPIIELSTPSPVYDEKSGLTRDTGMDAESCLVFKVCGTDVGQPFLLPNGSVGYLFGDTFAVAGPFLKDVPPGDDQYRAQVMLYSDMTPVKGQPIIFTGAAGLEGKGTAPEFLGQWHILMNDGVSLPNGDIVVSYQHTIEKKDGQDNLWYTDYAGLAISHDGGMSFQITGPTWENDSNDDDPYQMWSMQYDGNYVYIVSDRAGRQEGPMMLLRVPWNEMQDQTQYTYWNGTSWGDKSDAKPIMEGHFGEPSLRKLSDGTWALSYTDYSSLPKIVTQMIVDQDKGPEGTWSDPKVQLTAGQLQNPYGGGIHPDSTKDNLILMVSTWQTSGTAKDISDRTLVRYDVSHLVGSL